MKSKQVKRTQQKGFTIVELLVVVVIIAILAAITIVAYNGVTQRAVTSTLQTDLANSYRSLQANQIITGVYPADASSLKASGGNVYQYTVNNSANPPTFCLTATNTKVTTGYNISSVAGAPVQGLCSSHVQNPGGGSSAPVVTVQPSTSALFRYYDDDPMEYINLTSAATGNPTPTVVWQKRKDSGAWVNISDATSATLQEPVSYARGWTSSYYNGSSWSGLWTLRAAWTNPVGTTYSNASGVTTIYSVP